MFGYNHFFLPLFWNAFFIPQRSKQFSLRNKGTKYSLALFEEFSLLVGTSREFQELYMGNDIINEESSGRMKTFEHIKKYFNKN